MPRRTAFTIQQIINRKCSNAIQLITYFSRKSLKLISPDALISAKNAPNAIDGRAPPGPAGGAHNAPQTPIQGVLLLRGREVGMRPILYPDLGVEAPAPHVCL